MTAVRRLVLPSCDCLEASSRHSRSTGGEPQSMRASLTQITTKGDLALMIKVFADEKQWAKSKDKLRKLTESFRASVPRA